MMWRWLVLAGGLALLGSREAFADGALPPLPYNYLHPPPALASGNKAPGSANRTFSAGYVRTVTVLSVFTSDGQAGMVGARGAIVPDPGARSLNVQIHPVETPAGLPAQVAADGNAYRFSAVELPRFKQLGRVKVTVTMKWPHFPTAVYHYDAAGWKQLCSVDRAVLTSTTVSCPADRLGIFLVVTLPSSTNTPFPTPVPSGPFSWINPYIPFLAALGVIGLCLIAAFFVTRPDRRKAGKRQE